MYFNEGRKFPASLMDEVAEALAKTETAMGMKYGDAENPLLLSCRSGARKSMPGMMETVLNVGLCPATIPGLVKKSGSERFVYDAYRRLIMMYSDVVMEKAEDIEPAEGKGIRLQLEHLMAKLKKAKKYKADTDMTAADLKKLCEAVQGKGAGSARAGPSRTIRREQLWGAVGAVFKSWNGRRAVSYRKIEGIPVEWGTACNVQSMVFGNMGDRLGHRRGLHPQPGHRREQVLRRVARQRPGRGRGGRHPHAQPAERRDEERAEQAPRPRCRPSMPELYRQLCDIRAKLESHYHDMQDIEFTIQEGKLYMLQCRNGKRTGTAALNMAMDMLAEKLIDETTAVLRVEPVQLDELLHPIIDPVAEKAAEAVLSGLPAGPGGACGKIVFTSAEAVEEAKHGVTVILVREETNPEDVEGMRAAEGIFTARGGMTSHAALVARGWGKCCIVGAGEMKINLAARTMTAGTAKFKAGDTITLNGTKGRVYAGALAMIDATENPRFQQFMKLVDEHRTHGRADQRRHGRGRPRRPQLRGRGHWAVPHRAHVLRQGLRRAAVPAAEDDSQQHGGRAPRGRRGACSPSSSGASRRRSKRWKDCRSRSACWIRRCTSSCRRTRAPRPNWPRREASSRPKSRSAASCCTRPTP